MAERVVFSKSRYLLNTANPLMITAEKLIIFETIVMLFIHHNGRKNAFYVCKMIMVIFKLHYKIKKNPP